MNIVIKLSDHDISRLSCGCEVYIPFHNNSVNPHKIEAIVIRKTADYKGDKQNAGEL